MTGVPATREDVVRLMGEDWTVETQMDIVQLVQTLRSYNLTGQLASLDLLACDLLALGACLMKALALSGEKVPNEDLAIYAPVLRNVIDGHGLYFRNSLKNTVTDLVRTVAGKEVAIHE